MKNAIIIVNYNKKQLLKNCLQSIFLMNSKDFTVFVVDNGSKDSSVDMVKKDFLNVQIIEMNYNSGFCKANNIGIQKAINAGFENIILLNNDTEVDKFFLKELVAGINKGKKIEMVTPKVLFFYNKNKIDSTGLMITPDGMAVNRLLNSSSEDADDSVEVFCPTGAAALFTARLLNDIKQNDMFFDEDYEYYLEDLDMGWRARLRGWKCLYTPTSVVYHHKNATSGGYSKFIAFYTNRNLFYNIIKNYPSIFFFKAILLSFARYPYLILLAMNRKGVVSKFGKNITVRELSFITISGMMDVIVNLYKLLKRRRFIQNRREQNDFSQWFKYFGIDFFSSKK